MVIRILFTLETTWLRDINRRLYIPIRAMHRPITVIEGTHSPYVFMCLTAWPYSGIITSLLGDQSETGALPLSTSISSNFVSFHWLSLFLLCITTLKNTQGWVAATVATVCVQLLVTEGYSQKRGSRNESADAVSHTVSGWKNWASPMSLYRFRRLHNDSFALLNAEVRDKELMQITCLRGWYSGLKRRGRKLNKLQILMFSLYVKSLIEALVKFSFQVFSLR
jgi:hypothetical protein